MEASITPIDDGCLVVCWWFDRRRREQARLRGRQQRVLPPERCMDFLGVMPGDRFLSVCLRAVWLHTVRKPLGSLLTISMVLVTGFASTLLSRNIVVNSGKEVSFYVCGVMGDHVL